MADYLDFLYNPQEESEVDMTDYSSDNSSPLAPYSPTQNSEIPSPQDNDAYYYYPDPNAGAATYDTVYDSGYTPNSEFDSNQVYTSLDPVDTSAVCFEGMNYQEQKLDPELESYLIEVMGQVFARVGTHHYAIDPDDKFDYYNPCPGGVSNPAPMTVVKKEDNPVVYTPPKRTAAHRGTGRNRKLPRAERLWEFILRLLMDPSYNPSLIEWVDRSKGMFRLVNSKGIALMWGQRKNNNDMTYEKLSRAMRYYYHRKILQPVFGKKLVYKFGPNSTGWQLTELNVNDHCQRTTNRNVAVH